MTRILMTIMLTGAALAVLAMAPARSVETLNGVNPNGVNPNGLNPNGVAPNRLSANSLSLGANNFAGSERAANSAGEIGRVVAVELPRR